jgi:soluble cytochrome b562
MIQDPATKKDLEITKKELNKAIDGVKADLSGVKADLSEVKADLKNVKREVEHLAIREARNQVDHHEMKEQSRQQFDTLLTAIDGLAKLITDGQVEKVAAESALRRHDNLLEDHETRIGVLEKTAA